MTQRLRLVGIMLMVFGLVFFGGSAVAFSMYQDGAHSLQSFSEVQGVELDYNDQGQLVDRGDTAAAEGIMAMLETEWGYPVSDREMDPNDPLVNTASEYMYQMAVVTHHVIDGTYEVTLTEDQVVDADGNALTELAVNGETVPVPDPFPADGPPLVEPLPSPRAEREPGGAVAQHLLGKPGAIRADQVEVRRRLVPAPFLRA